MAKRMKPIQLDLVSRDPLNDYWTLSVALATSVSCWVAWNVMRNNSPPLSQLIKLLAVNSFVSACLAWLQFDWPLEIWNWIIEMLVESAFIQFASTLTVFASMCLISRAGYEFRLRP